MKMVAHLLTQTGRTATPILMTTETMGTLRFAHSLTLWKDSDMNDFTPGTRVRVADDFGSSIGKVDKFYRGQMGTVKPDKGRYIVVEMDNPELGEGLFLEDELTVV
jgi:ribosomal protein L21E